MAGRGRRKKNNNRAGKLCIGMIVIAFVAVMSPDHQSLPERSGIHAAGGVASETVRGRNRKGRTAEQL